MYIIFWIIIEWLRTKIITHQSFFFLGLNASIDDIVPADSSMVIPSSRSMISY